MSIADLSRLKSALIIGSTLRKDHPLLAQRLRQAVKHGAQLNLINPFDDDLLTKVANRATVPPAKMASALAQVLRAAAESQGKEMPDHLKEVAGNAEVNDEARAMASSLINNQPAAILIGNLAQHHPSYADIQVLAQHLAEVTGARLGTLGEAANSVGAYIAGAVPGKGGNARQMLGADGSEPCRAYLLMNVEPELDSYDPQQTIKALNDAEMVVMLSSYRSEHVLSGDYADVLLPIAPFTETSGTFINTEGRIQSFNGVVAPLGETRPAWKVLRVLGNMLGLEGFDYETPEQLRAEILPAGEDIKARLANELKGFVATVADGAGETGASGIQRIGEVPIYQADPIVRRAESLQRTRDAAPPVVRMADALMERLGISDGDQVRVRQGNGEAQLTAARDKKLPDGCARIAAAHPLTAALGGMFGEIAVEKL
jgi:NADH-quinone oxidoreductase subunit G